MIYFHKDDLEEFVSHRKGETRVGERVRTLRRGETLNALGHYHKEGAKYCLVGIPESIGAMANYGRRGAEKSWNAFLPRFLNVQSNRFFDGKEVLVLGSVDTKKLQKRAESLSEKTDYYHTKLHIICAELDELVSPIVEAIIRANMVPIIIGGGHNNSFPILRGVSKALGRKCGINAINLDPHANFRALEGRHSGNAMSYAKETGVLYKYFAFGLHQSYNSENMLRLMDTTRNVKYQFLEDITYLDKHLMLALDYVHDDHVPCGLELGMDSIRNMPSSAEKPSGFSLEQARHFIRKGAESLDVAYLYLSEAAVVDSGDELIVGKSLSYLVMDFMKSTSLA